MAGARPEPGVAPGGASGGPGNRTPGQKPRLAFLNALPLNALPGVALRLTVETVSSLDDLRAFVEERLRDGYEIVHYIRHPATIAALRQAGIPVPEQPYAGLYRWQHDDVMVVITLRSPQRGQETAQVREEDLDIRIVWVEV